MLREYNSIIFIMFLVLLPILAMGQTTIVVKDDSIQAGDTITWTANNEYVLDGLVYVEDGAVLYIEPGTIIKAKQTPSNGDNTSALIISRGGKIYAEGTATQPIIFTAESDDINDPTDLSPSDRGLWGGLILLGKATINTATGEGQIEGIDPNEPRAAYGGGNNPNDNDTSGVLRYVSIRHGGSEIAPGDEINGLTLGAVGRGTIIEYVEIYANLDDGVEFFGGTVNIRYLVSAYNADDGIDYDEGYRGKGQFWFVLQGPDFAGRSAEQDGGTNPEDGQPYAIPVIANATYIGPGTSAFPQGDGGEQIIFRDNAGGKYFNSIFTEYNGGQGGVGIRIEDLSSGEDSRHRLETGDLILKNNIWWNFGAGNTWNDIAPQDFVRDSLIANNNQVVDPQLNNVSSRLSDIDPRPNPNGPAASGAVTVNDSFFVQVDYLGAFDPNAPLWTDGWTALSQDSLTVTGIQNESRISSNVPGQFVLRQNYPNPFNPSTTIEYAVARRGMVTLTLFNALGQKVATLVNEIKQPGTYRLTLDATNLAGGIYFYRLQAPDFNATRKMILLK